MKTKFDQTSYQVSKIITNNFSTSFSIGIYLLDKSIRNEIYSIYGFVRCADEIVDSFYDYDRKEILSEYISSYKKALKNKVSPFPTLNSFQQVVNQYALQDLVNLFLESMRMDLHKTEYKSQEDYEKYILGSAEVVGLMCLKVFVGGNEQKYLELKPFAQKLGSAFQKVNFLRDLKEDYQELGRVYFPNICFEDFNEENKAKIIQEVIKEFDQALEGIKKLPANCKLGVYMAYKYYLVLLKKLQAKNATELMKKRIRVPNFMKGILLIKAYIRYQLNIL